MAKVASVSNQELLELSVQMDQWIRQGQSSLAKTELSNLLEKKIKIPRSLAVDFSNIARRLSQHYLSLQIMRPYIHPTVPLHPPASATEQAVYAGALAKIGAAAEAWRMLETLDPSPNPEIYFHKSTIHFQRWEYSKAIPLLKKYIQHKAISEYERLVGKVNLAAAFVIERKSTQASHLLLELLELTGQQNLKLLYGNVLELFAQLEIACRNFSQAETYLQLAHQGLAETSSLSEFFIRKWLTILALQKQAQPGPVFIDNLRNIRQEALERRHWESVRECDFYLSLVLKDKDIFCHVYFGTPFLKYRQKMKAQVNFSVTLPATYCWQVGLLPDPKNLRIFDMEKAKEVKTNISLPVGGVLHLALNILCTDFYRPVSETSFFAHLFPDEYFNPENSPARVSQVIHRLRSWFVEAQIPLDVEVSQREYRLIANEGYGILVLQTQKPMDFRLSRLETLKHKWPYQSFAVREASVELQCSVSAASRLLSWAAKNRKILRSGNGSSISYRFAK